MKQILSIKEACELSRHYQNMGKKVSFVHGIFDILHPGHIDLLQKAKASSDILIVGIDDDNTAKFLKGPTRPIMDQTSRLFTIANLKPVDHAFLIEPGENMSSKKLRSFYVRLYQDFNPNFVVSCSDADNGCKNKQDDIQRMGREFINVKSAFHQNSTTAVISQIQNMTKSRPRWQHLSNYYFNHYLPSTLFI